MEGHRRKQRSGGAGDAASQKKGLQARSIRQGKTCEHCGHKLSLNDILFIEDGVYASYQLKANRGSLDFELYEIGGDADAYFTCRYCGETLKEITESWWSGGEEAVTDVLR